MVLNIILGALAVLSVILLFWQWVVGRQFPLHRRSAGPPATANTMPGITLLKPLKGVNMHTEMCLRSWLTQDYAGPVQVLFGVAAPEDPACSVVRKLLAEFPAADAQLVICPDQLGANPKVSTLIQLERLAKHALFCVSDADVQAPGDLLAEAVPLLSPSNSQPHGAALVNCFYRLANPSTRAMQLEAVAVNVDFWSQVLQSCSLRPMAFALGAAMLTRREDMVNIGGFIEIKDCLADDYQIGNRIAKHGGRIVISPVVVECWDAPAGWADVWKHQVRWARTIRISQPTPYFFSLLSNPTLWPLLWAVATLSSTALLVAGFALTLRLMVTIDFQRRMERKNSGKGQAMLRTNRHRFHGSCWLVLGKDVFQVAVWVAAFAGNSIEWRGRRMKLQLNGNLVES